ncbi:hypothetical protein L1887_53631 [Cichorium endivia]|nr:hypothetical protein L1887_53631 [Cichorium endivia]
MALLARHRRHLAGAHPRARRSARSVDLRLAILPAPHPPAHPHSPGRRLADAPTQTSRPIYRNANSPAGFDPRRSEPRKEINDICRPSSSTAPNGSERNAQRAIYGIGKIEPTGRRGCHFICNRIHQALLGARAADCACGSRRVRLLREHRRAPLPTHTLRSARVTTPSSCLPTSLSPQPPPPSRKPWRARAHAPPSASTQPPSPSAPCFSSPCSTPRRSSSSPTLISKKQPVTSPTTSARPHRLRLYAYDAVLAAGSPGSLLGPDTSSRDVIEPHPVPLLERHQLRLARRQALPPRRWRHLQPRRVPRRQDPPTPTTTSLSRHAPPWIRQLSKLMATRTPLGFALALTALYTGAAISADLPASSYDDPNPAASAAFARAQPTLVYATAEGASSLACALASCTRRSPLASWAATNKLFTLRNGSFARNSLADTLVYNSARSAVGCSRVRTLMIAGRGRHGAAGAARLAACPSWLCRAQRLCAPAQGRGRHGSRQRHACV